MTSSPKGIFALTVALCCILPRPLSAEEKASTPEKGKDESPAPTAAPAPPAAPASSAEVEPSEKRTEAKKPARSSTPSPLTEALRKAQDADRRSAQAKANGQRLAGERLAEVAKIWRKVAKAQERAVELEKRAAEIERKTLELEGQARRARSLVEQTEARRARALAELRKLGLTEDSEPKATPKASEEKAK